MTIPRTIVYEIGDLLPLPDSVLRPTLSDFSGQVNSFEDVYGAELLSGALFPSTQLYGHDVVFSVTDTDTVEWAAGTLKLSSGQEFTILAGNTGTMSAKTYIYFDKRASQTTFQVTTSFDASVGANKILIAVAENGTTTATFQVFGGAGGTNIVVNSITATSGTIGGFDIGADYVRDAANTMGLASTVSGSDDVRFWAGASFANRATAAFRVTEAGAVTASSISITGGSISGTTTVGVGNVNIAARGWTQTSVFSVTDADTVAWASGTFTSADGTSYSIGAGNTGNMAAATYIYLDTAVSTTAYQTTTTATTAVGAGKVLIAKAQNGTGEATFQVFGGIGGQNIDALSIVANSITANELSTSITYAGTIIVSTGGNIRSGQTAYNTGTGWFLGNDGGTPKFSIGSSTGDRLTWDGTELAVFGTFNIGGQVKTVDTFAEIQTALDAVSAAGGGTVYLESGTYTFTTDISVPAGVKLSGVARDAVILDVDAYTLKLTGSDAYSTGTVTINDGDTTVVGSGTTWTSAMVGREILLNGFYYEITARTDNTHITIAGGYAGPNLAGASYVLATVNHNPEINRLTVIGGTGAGVTCIYCFEPNINDVVVTGCTTGIDMDYTVYPLLFTTCEENGVNANLNYVFGFEARFSAFDYSTSGAGLVLTNSGNATFFDSSATGNTGNGVSITSCSNIAFLSTTWGTNGGHGVEMISGNTDLQFVAANPIGNTGDGYKLTATSDRVSISTCSITDNGGYGVNIAASTCDNNTIVAPSFSGNTSGTISDSGADTVIIAESDSPYISLSTYASVTGATNPVPMYVTTGGYADIGDANVSGKQKFFGFTNETVSGLPAVLNTDNTTTSGGTLTCNAGDDRLLIVNISYRRNGSDITFPSGITWGATNLINIDNDFSSGGANRYGQSTWYAVIGSSGSNQGQTITVTGDAYNDRAITYTILENVNQSTPFGNTGNQSTGASTTPSNTITTTIPNSLVVYCLHSSTQTVSSYNDGMTTLQTHAGGTGNRQYIATVQWNTIGSNAFDCTLASGTSWVAMALEILGIPATVNLRTGGQQTGFTGLTIGAPYYLSDTAGTISTTPGTTTVLLGKASSATALLVIQS